MVNRAIILFLVALCLFQLLHGGFSTPRFPRSSDPAAETDDGNSPTDETSRTLESWRENFDSLFQDTNTLNSMMQRLNESLRGLSATLDQLGNTLSTALENATRTQPSTPPPA